jgi:hypothetical protein
MRIRVSIGAAFLAAILALPVMPSPASAQSGAPPLVCPAGYTFARGTGCVSNAVVRQAKYNCKNGPAHSNAWWECVCNDGGKIAACGD